MKWTKTKSGLLCSPKCRMVYPSLFTPRAMKGETDPSKAKYQISILVPKAADMALLQGEVAAVVKDKWGDKALQGKLKKPWLKTEEQDRFGEYAEDFPVMIRLQNKNKVGVVDGRNAPVSDEEMVYSGRWCMVLARPFAWEHPANGRGISLSLEGVQLLDNADPIGAGPINPANEFEAVEGESAEALFG